MGIHVEGEDPESLLKKVRPNEPQNIRDYRLESYEPKTKSLSEKVINTVNKIFNPRLWSFNFPEMNGITGDQTLAKYLTEDFPVYRTLMNFITETYTTKDFSDPNAAIVILPKNFEIEETELFEPVPVIYDSESLVDFVDEEYYTFLFKEQKIVKVFTTTDITYYRREGEKWVVFFEYTHDFGVVPVFRMGGIVKGKTAPNYFESWINGRVTALE